MARVAIFNGFPFHYEMFGYIIHYCKKNNLQLDIYTNFERQYNWFHLYEKLFANDATFFFTFYHFREFENKRNNYDIVFIATDDDPNFKNEWMTPKTICIDHHYTIRRTTATNHIATRPFKENARRWSLPCFKVVDISAKKRAIDIGSHEFAIHIAIVGGTHSLKDGKYNINIINRLHPINNKYKIILHAISRNISPTMFSGINQDIQLQIYSNVDTFEMIQILEKCSYFLTDVDYNNDHSNGYSMSGGVPLAFSNLLPLILSKQNNELYNFTSAVVFDIDNNDDILLSENVNPLFDLVDDERNQLMDMFDTNVKDIMSTSIAATSSIASTSSIAATSSIATIPENTSTNTALLVEPRFLKKIPMLINEYSKILGTKWKIVFYCGKDLKKEWDIIFDLLHFDSIQLVNLEIRELDMEKMNFIDYNNFLRSKILWESLYGEYVLVFQLDTMIKNIEPYTIDNYIALNKSYIGSNMFYDWHELKRENIFPAYKNFNGGLSLRKRKDMIKIIDTFGVENNITESKTIATDLEDVYFTLGCYKLNLPVGDDEFCSHFSIHTIYHEKFFGMHKSTWFPRNEILSMYPDIESFCYLGPINDSDFIRK